MENSKIIAQINQHFHNQGVKQEDRFNALIDILQGKRKSEEISVLLSSLDYENTDLIQALFMTIGSKMTKFNLDQFYTPLTISKFINSLMSPTGRAIDPAGGTGDLLLFHKGPKEIWDIDENALKLCKFNYELHKHHNYTLSCRNSLLDFEKCQDSYDYVVMNPPFGTSTVVTDDKILKQFRLSVGKRKQEIGILFLELGLKLLKPNGIMFIILPAGYLGNANKNCTELRDLILENRVIASIALPENTFKRSGTGVNTYLLVVQKGRCETPYNIYIAALKEIGYNLTKKDTPLKYKISRKTGELRLKDGKPVLDNDLDRIYEQVSFFALDNEISELETGKDTQDVGYECVSSEELSGNVLDVKRYLSTYLDIVQSLTESGGKPLREFGRLISTNTALKTEQKYKYIDISGISWPLYSSKDLYGWEVPSRGKYAVKKYDILISKLEGKLSYCVILDDSPNYIATNGVAVIRPKDMRSLYILVANMIKKEFTIQHNAFLTGSIMASVSDADIGEILVAQEPNVDLQVTKKIIDTLEQLVTLQLS